MTKWWNLAQLFWQAPTRVLVGRKKKSALHAEFSCGGSRKLTKYFPVNTCTWIKLQIMWGSFSVVSSLAEGGASVQNCKRPSAFFWTPLAFHARSLGNVLWMFCLWILNAVSICGSPNFFLFFYYYCVRYLTASSQFCVSPSAGLHLHTAFPPSSAIEKWQQTAYEAWGLWHSRSETATSVLSQTDMPTHKLSSGGRSPVAHFSCGSSRAKRDSSRGSER